MPLKSKKKKLSPKQLKLHNFSLGSNSEKIAVNYLIGLKYQILATNYQVNQREVDIVALDQNHQEVVFVEVKSRSTLSFGNPSQAVNYKKLANLKYVAKAFISQYNLDFDYRFDIITVVGSEIEQYENVTWI